MVDESAVGHGLRTCSRRFHCSTRRHHSLGDVGVFLVQRGRRDPLFVSHGQGEGHVLVGVGGGPVPPLVGPEPSAWMFQSIRPY